MNQETDKNIDLVSLGALNLGKKKNHGGRPDHYHGKEKT